MEARGDADAESAPASAVTRKSFACDAPDPDDDESDQPSKKKWWASELLLAFWPDREPHPSRRHTSTASTLLTLMFACSLLVLHWSFSRSELIPGRPRNPSPAARAPAPKPAGNATARILEELRRNGSSECHRQHTRGSRLFLRSEDGTAQAMAFPDPVRLASDTLHSLELVSVTEGGLPRCAGGDFYEIDLVSEGWHSRPPTTDLGDGSYRLLLRVDSRFAHQAFNLSVTLLFDAFHGLDHDCQPWQLGLRTLFLHLHFILPPPLPPPFPLSPCGEVDFDVSEWSGRWARGWGNDSCSPDRSGRFSGCLDPAHGACIDDFCSGRVARLESNGWVYSAHCAFRIYEAQEAWDCLAGRWLLFWGDSNFQDTIRNLLLFVLDYPVPYWSTLASWQIPRMYEEVVVNPGRPDQAIRLSLVFNGHFQVEEGGLGLDSLLNEEYRESIRRHFQGKVAPDVVVLNSGLHDGQHFPTVESFAEGAGRAAGFWKEVWGGRDVGARPRMVYKTTIAPAGESRGMQSNPHKMEVFNRIMVEKMQAEMPGVVKVVDAFDLSFPWHYDNNYSDGGHYGRAPNVDKWPWFGQPHQYFVDVMLAHILLNAVCQP